MLFRLVSLLTKSGPKDDLVKKSYDKISYGYDDVWTNHMRHLTEALIEQLDIHQGQKAIDLTCGTGFATNLIAKQTKEKVLGVDSSSGMLTQARQKHNQTCEFIRADIIKHLKTIPSNSVDIVTCCWGIGYSKPFAVLRQIKRILKPNGKVGIIDNSLFSLREIIWCSFLTFMEYPDELINLMKFRFLMGCWQLALWYRILGLQTTSLWSGQKSYTVNSGKTAIEKLQATGAAAGFEYASKESASEQINQRFAEILEEKYMDKNEITITHRYLAGIAVK